MSDITAFVLSAPSTWRTLDALRTAVLGVLAGGTGTSPPAPDHVLRALILLLAGVAALAIGIRLMAGDRPRGRKPAFPLGDLLDRIRREATVRVPGVAVFLHPESCQGTPPALLINLRHNHVLHRKVLLVAVEIAAQPQGARARIIPWGEGLYRIVLRFGANEEPDLPGELVKLVLDGEALAGARISYFLETCRPARSGFAWKPGNRARDAMTRLCIPPDRVFELRTPEA